jgi:hypothetical protein
MVETAIVMPLFVFMVLGTFQLGLMHQARLLTKYASYKATRAGAIHSAKQSVMEAAALTPLLPIIARTANGGETYFKISNVTEAKAAFDHFWDRTKVKNHEGTNIPVLKITVCNPTRSTAETGDFDYPSKDTNVEPEDTAGDENEASGDPGAWAVSDQTKLAVQVTLNYRLVIPFANMVLWYIAWGEENADLLRMTRLGLAPAPKASVLGNEYKTAADQHIYLVPIHANWNMRMQSNFLANQSGFELPLTSDCIVPFPKK